MKIPCSFAALMGFVLWAAGSSARADEPEHSATLHCDAGSNRALVVLDGTTEYANPPVPPEVDLGLSRLGPAPGNVCRLKDGREVKVKFDHDQAFPYGECGADPFAFLSLWVDRRKVFSRAYFYGGCHQGLVLKAILLDENRLTKCNISPPDMEGEGEPGALVCADATDKLLAAQNDAVEYPPANAAKRRVGSIEVQQAKDPAFCERFINRDLSTEPKPRMDGLMDYWRAGDAFVPDATAIPVERGEQVTLEKRPVYLPRFDADNDGTADDVIWFYGSSHYFDGDYFLIKPSDPTLVQTLLSRLALEELEEKFVEWARSAGVSVYSGADTLYQTTRYTHFYPTMADGRTMVWAWPTNITQLPTALLYEPGPKGKLTPVCTFQRVEENF